MSAQVVCPHCGSKETEERKGSFYYCKECTNEFGRDRNTDDGVPLVEAIQGLRFSYGNMVTGSIRIRFAWDEEGQTCVYEVYQVKDGKINKIADTIEQKEFDRIRNSLVNTMFVQDWDKVYYPINDGSSFNPDAEWRLDIIVKDEDERTYRGIDAYPPYFSKLNTYLKKYFAKLEEN